jgi:hypothetical protein
MATYINRSPWTVSVKRRENLTRTFAFAARAKAIA